MFLQCMRPRDRERYACDFIWAESWGGGPIVIRTCSGGASVFIRAFSGGACRRIELGA